MKGGEFMKENFHGITEDSCCSTAEKRSTDIESKINRLRVLGPIGAIISAILASQCCVGPFVLVMLPALQQLMLAI